MTPEPSDICVSGGRLKRSPKKRWNEGSSSSGLRRFTWRVAEMLTTDGIAFWAASLKESVRGPGSAMAASGGVAGAELSRTSTTWRRQVIHSGFTRLTTKITARVAVTAWAKTSQSLRIRETGGLNPDCTRGKGGFFRLARAQRVADLA